MKIAKEPISIETPIGEDEDSNLGDFIEDSVSESPSDNATGESLKEVTKDILSSREKEFSKAQSIKSSLRV